MTTRDDGPTPSWMLEDRLKKLEQENARLRAMLKQVDPLPPLRKRADGSYDLGYATVNYTHAVPWAKP